jgi:hypothetical protein
VLENSHCSILSLGQVRGCVASDGNPEPDQLHATGCKQPTLRSYLLFNNFSMLSSYNYHGVCPVLWLRYDLLFKHRIFREPFRRISSTFNAVQHNTGTSKHMVVHRAGFESMIRKFEWFKTYKASNPYICTVFY